MGCGTGRLPHRAVASFPHAELIGVDVSAEMIRHSNGSRRESEPSLPARLSRVTALPDGLFDLALTTASFHHWADQAGGLAEVQRVLRPDGPLVLADFLAAGALGLPGLAWIIGRFDGGRINRPRVLDRMLAQAGFEVVRRTPAPHFAGAAQFTVASRL